MYCKGYTGESQSCLQLQNEHVKFRLVKIEFHKNTVVNTSRRLVTGIGKDFHLIKMCVNLSKGSDL